MSNLQGEVNVDLKIVGTVTNPRSADSAYQTALNNGFVGTEAEWVASLKGEKGDKGEQGVQGEQGIQGEKGDKGDKGDTYAITEADYIEIADVVEDNIQPQLDDIKETTEQAEAIAKGRATGYVFDTVEDLDLWLQDSENTSKLVLGDNLYIKATDVPDYWWDGTTKQQLETQKVDLTEYVKEEDTEELVKNTLQKGMTEWTIEEQYAAGINYAFFGLGGTSRLVSGDWNTACEHFNGFYRGHNLANSPGSSEWYYVLHISHDEQYKKQLAFDLFSDDTYVRTQIEGTWRNWRKITLV